MRTHPDTGLAIVDLLQLARFWLCMCEECFQFESTKHHRVFTACSHDSGGGDGTSRGEGNRTKIIFERILNDDLVTV